MAAKRGRKGRVAPSKKKKTQPAKTKAEDKETEAAKQDSPAEVDNEEKVDEAGESGQGDADTKNQRGKRKLPSADPVPAKGKKKKAA